MIERVYNGVSLIYVQNAKVIQFWTYIHKLHKARAIPDSLLSFVGAEL